MWDMASRTGSGYRTCTTIFAREYSIKMDLLTNKKYTQIKLDFRLYTVLQNYSFSPY
jgi:hypothetical protein